MQHLKTILVFLSLMSIDAYAQHDAGSGVNVIRMSETIGDTIDATERENYHLFGSYEGFKYALFVKGLDGIPKALITVDREGEEKVLTQPYTWSKLKLVQEQIIYLGKKIEKENIRATKLRKEEVEDSIRISKIDLIWLNSSIGGGNSTAWVGGYVSLSWNQSAANSNRLWTYRSASIIEGGLELPIGIGDFETDLSNSRKNMTQNHNQKFKTISHTNSNGDFPYVEKEDETVSDLGVLTGVIYKGPYGFLSLTAGLALVYGERRVELKDEYKMHSFYTIGIPFEASASLKFTPYCGEGLQISGNLNPECSFITLNLTVQIGRLKAK